MLKKSISVITAAYVVYFIIRCQRCLRLARKRKHEIRPQRFGWTNLYRAALIDHAIQSEKEITRHVENKNGTSLSGWPLIDGSNKSILVDCAANEYETKVERAKRIVRHALRIKIKMLVHGTARCKKRWLLLDNKHWMEALDPKHRYGSNLEYYFAVWKHSETTESFFHWLDHGEGMEIDLEDCPREKMEHTRVKYFGSHGRKKLQVYFTHGVMRFVHTDEIVHSHDKYKESTHCTKPQKMIFACDLKGRMYVAPKIRGKFHHSSMLAGGPALAAGNMIVRNGILERITPHSGHYRPTTEDFNFFLNQLKEWGVPLKTVTIGHFKPAKKTTKSTK